MKAFIAAVFAMVVIAIGAGVTLNATGKSSGEKFSTTDVRLD